MNERDFNELREACWRRKLTPAEEAGLLRHLAANPNAQADWEADVALTQGLTQLAEPPLSSNFTAQVLQAAARASNTPAVPSNSLGFWLRRLMPRMAWAAAVVGLTFFAWQQYEIVQRNRMAKGIVPVLASLPQPELLQDFDAIRQLSQSPPSVDMELLTAFSQ
jgi:anti-sigma factor RsiW